MDEEFIAMLYNTDPNFEERGISLSKFTTDLADEDFQRFYFDFSKFEERGLSFEKFQKDLGVGLDVEGIPDSTEQPTQETSSPEIQDNSILGNIGRNLAAGSGKLVTSIAKIPGALQDIGNIVPNKIMEFAADYAVNNGTLTKEEGEKRKQELKDYGNFLDFDALHENDFIRGIDEASDQMSALSRAKFKGKDSFQLFKEGDIAQGMEALTYDVVSAIPGVAVMVASGGISGIALVGAGAGADKFEQLQSEGVDDVTAAFNGVAVGVSDMLFNKIGLDRIGKPLRDVIKKVGVKKWKTQTASGVVQGVKRTTGPGFIESAAVEMAEEGATQWTENFVEVLTGLRDKEDIMEGVGAAALAGGGLGTGITGLRKGIESTQNKQFTDGFDPINVDPIPSAKVDGEDMSAAELEAILNDPNKLQDIRDGKINLEVNNDPDLEKKVAEAIKPVETVKSKLNSIDQDITDKKVFIDFDDTLATTDDNGVIELTSLGKEIKEKVASGEIKDIEVLTASQGEGRAETISKLTGIPVDQIRTGLSPEQKAEAVSNDGTDAANKIFIDNDSKNLEAVSATGTISVDSSSQAKGDTEETKPDIQTDVVEKQKPLTQVEEKEAQVDEIIGKRVDYNGIEGVLAKDSEGNVIVITHDEDVFVESALSGATITELGIKVIPPPVITEAEVTKILQDPLAMQIDWSTNRISYLNKEYSFNGFNFNGEGDVVSAGVTDSKGKQKTITGKDIMFHMEYQKILYDEFINKKNITTDGDFRNEFEAEATKLGIKPRSPVNKGNKSSSKQVQGRGQDKSIKSDGKKESGRVVAADPAAIVPGFNFLFKGERVEVIPKVRGEQTDVVRFWGKNTNTAGTKILRDDLLTKLNDKKNDSYVFIPYDMKSWGKINKESTKGYVKPAKKTKAKPKEVKTDNTKKQDLVPKTEKVKLNSKRGKIFVPKVETKRIQPIRLEDIKPGFNLRFKGRDAEIAPKIKGDGTNSVRIRHKGTKTQGAKKVKEEVVSKLNDDKNKDYQLPITKKATTKRAASKTKPQSNTDSTGIGEFSEGVGEFSEGVVVGNPSASYATTLTEEVDKTWVTTNSNDSIKDTIDVDDLDKPIRGSAASSIITLLTAVYKSKQLGDLSQRLSKYARATKHGERQLKKKAAREVLKDIDTFVKDLVEGLGHKEAKALNKRIPPKIKKYTKKGGQFAKLFKNDKAFLKRLGAKSRDDFIAAHLVEETIELNIELKPPFDNRHYIEELGDVIAQAHVLGLVIGVDVPYQIKLLKKPKAERSNKNFKIRTAKELTQVAKITNKQADTISEVITTVVGNIAKRLGITQDVYHKKLSIKTVKTNINTAIRKTLKSDKLWENFTVLKQESVLKQYAVLGKYLRAVKGMTKQDLWLSKLMDHSSEVDGNNGWPMLHTLKTKEAVEDAVEKRLTAIHDKLNNNVEQYLVQNITDKTLRNRIARAEKLNNVNEISQWNLILKDNQAKKQYITHKRQEQMSSITINNTYLQGNPAYSSAFKLLVLTDMIHNRYSVDDGGNIRRQKIKTSQFKYIDSPIAQFNVGALARAFHNKAGNGDRFVGSSILYEFIHAPVVKLSENYDKYKHKELPTGTWLKFPQGNDPIVADHLFEVTSTSHKHAAKWCTGGCVGTAVSQLQEGDFYVFIDKKSKEASVAVRYDGTDTIGEVRGLGEGQALLPEDSDTLDDIVDNFPDGDSYAKDGWVQKTVKAVRDGTLLLEDLEIEELWSLKAAEDRSYNESDVLLQSVQQRINRKLFIKKGIHKDEIVDNINSNSITTINNTTVRFVVNDINADDAISLTLPKLEKVGGDINVYNAISLTLPKLERVGDNLNTNNATSLTLPKLEKVGGSIDVYNAISLTLPKLERVGGYLNASNATSLTLPKLERVDGSIDVHNAISLTLPKLERVGGGIDVNNATSLTLPKLEKVVFSINASNATSLTLPKLERVGDNLNANNAISLTLPKLERLGGGINAYDATSLTLPKLEKVVFSINALNATSLTLPKLERVGDNLNVGSATSLTLPKLERVGGSIDVNNATSLTLPKLERVDGSIDVNNAISLTLPKLERVDGSIDVNNAISLTLAKLERVGDHLNANRVTSLTLPKLERVGGSINASNATSLTLAKLEKVVFSINASNATSLTLPKLERVGGSINASNATSLTLANSFQPKRSLPQGNNVVIKFEGKVDLLKQDGRGAILRGTERSAILLSGKGADVTTPIHEIIHEYEKVLTTGEKEVLEDWSGHKSGTTAFSEAFAVGGEKFIYDGGIGDQQVFKIFEKLSKWFKKVIDSAVDYFGGINELNDDVRNIYSAMLLGDYNNHITTETRGNSTTGVGLTKENITPRELANIMKDSAAYDAFMKSLLSSKVVKKKNC